MFFKRIIRGMASKRIRELRQKVKHLEEKNRKLTNGIVSLESKLHLSRLVEKDLRHRLFLAENKKKI